MRLFIEPSDVLLFRSSRPFNAGESGYLESLFPPTPETVQGAIRARIAACWNPVLSEAFKDERLTQWIGTGNKVGRFRLRGLTLGRRGNQDRDKIEPLFPPPAHLLRGEESERVYRLMPTASQHSVATNMPGQKLPTSGAKTAEPDADDSQLLGLEPEGGYPDEKLEDFRAWLTREELGKALGSDAGAIEGIKGTPASELYDFEPRLGIGMNNASKTTREGFLYQVSFVRLKPGVGFLVDVGLENVEPGEVQKTLKLPDRGWLALGGERRAASFEVLRQVREAAETTLEPGERACIYFSTPTYFDAGWRPVAWKGKGSFGAVPVGAAVARWQPIGGWQQEPGNAHGEPKLLRRCVPAGSVYFFDTRVEVAGPITHYGPEIGYGIAYKGAWQHV